MDVKAADALRFVQLLADEQRWQLVGHLAQGDLRVGELCALLGRPQNLVSYHLGEMRAGGLLTSRRSSADGRDTYYRLDLQRCAEMLTGLGAAIVPGPLTSPTRPSARTSGRRPRVLFLCTGNSARSQMAEALLVHHSNGEIDARSAGSRPKPLHPDAVRVMAERGIDISTNVSKHIDRIARLQFDRVVTMCDKVREVCPELPGHPPATHWSMPDPSLGDGDTYSNFVRAAEEIEQRIHFLIPQLTSAA